MPFCNFMSAHSLQLKYVSLWNNFGLLEWAVRVTFPSDFSFKSRDDIQLTTFIAISIDNSFFCKERIFGSKLISEGYSATKLGNVY